LDKESQLFLLTRKLSKEAPPHLVEDDGGKTGSKGTMKAPDYVAYTDGGYSVGRDEGAYAFVLLKKGKIIGKSAVKLTDETSNRMELHAVIAAVGQIPDGSSILVISDSRYAIGALSGKFLFHENRNADLIQQWWNTVKDRGIRADFKWIKAHSGNKYNEMCDQMCVDAVGHDLDPVQEIDYLPENQEC